MTDIGGSCDGDVEDDRDDGDSGSFYNDKEGSY